MLRFGMLGAGRIGQIHGNNIANSAGATAGRARRRGQGGRRPARRGDRRGGPRPEGDHRRRRHRRDPDRHADGYACRPDRGGRRRPARRYSAKSRSRSTSKRVEKCMQGGRSVGRSADDRLQPPLRPEFRRAEEAHRRPARSARSRSCPIISRDPGPPPISYIERSGGLYRDMMIHDFDIARFMLDEEPVEVTAYGSSWSIRRSARPATSTRRW